MDISIIYKVTRTLVLLGGMSFFVLFAKAENHFSVCTMDINQYGYSSNCSCSRDKRYNPKIGKCIELSISQKQTMFQNILSNLISSIEENESDLSSFNKLQNHLEVLLYKMDEISEIYELDLKKMREIKQGILESQFDLEVCQYESKCDDTVLLKKLSALTSHLQKLIITS